MKALDELEGLAKAATPGPYELIDEGDVIFIRGQGQQIATWGYEWSNHPDRAEDAANILYFLAIDPGTILKIIESHRELYAALDTAMEYIDNATIIDDLNRDSLKKSWDALAKFNGDPQ